MEERNFCCYEFGEYRLDGRRRSLTKNGEKVPLPARNFDLLIYMVENSGRILEHDELLDKVWAGTFVEQATLKKGISALRQILAEKPENEFIKTIPRRGYSFVSPVRVVPENDELYLVRETEREIIVEEYEEIDETEDFNQPETVIEIPAASFKALPSAEPPKTKLSRAAVLGGAAIAVLLLALFGLKPYFSKTAQSQFSVENVRVNRLTNNGKVIDTTISPDGNYLLYPAADKDGVSLWLRQIAANNTIRLTPPAKGGFWGFDFAPDNSYVYYIFNNTAEPQKSGLYKIPLLGGEARKLNENVSSVVAAPDGKRLALVRLTDKTNIFTVNTEGADERLIAAYGAEMRLQGISWTPDGASLLCTFRRITGDKPLYYIAEISPENGKEIVILPPQDKIIFGGIWLPDKSAIIVTMREPNADIRQIWQYFPAGQEWRRVTNDDNSYKYANLTRDGKTIVSKQESRLVAIWVTKDLPLEKRTPDKKSLLDNSDSFRQITDGANNFDWLSWLSDNRIMYSATEGSREMLFTVNANGTNARQITSGEDGIWLFPSATGNRQSICFLSWQNGVKQAMRVDADGKNLVKMTQLTASIFNARILRDNTTVLYTIQQPKGIFLFKQTADGQTTQLTDTTTGAFAVSADEKLLAVEVTDKETSKEHVELRSFEDGKTIKTFDFVSVREMHFTPDDKNLAYDSPRGELNQIMIQPLDGSEAYALTNFQTDYIFSFGWSPDGSQLAVIRGKQLNDAAIIKTANP